VDCPGYSESDDGKTIAPDQLLQFFSGFGTYVKDGDEPTSLNLIWEGTSPEEFVELSIIGSSEVTVDADKVTLHYLIDIPEPASGSSIVPWLKPGQRLVQGPVHVRSAWFSGWPALPLQGVVAWLQRRRRKWARLALVILLVLVAFWLSSYLGSSDFTVWGTIDATYTFDKLEYIDLQQAARGAEDQPGVTWKLTNGQGVVDLDLIFESETTGPDGTTVKETEPCKLTITGSATGTIGPDGSVAPPDTGE